MTRKNRLTFKKIRSLGAGKHGDGEGLWIYKTKKEAGKWVLRYFAESKRREMGLGRWPDVSLAEARQSAIEARRQLRDGLDPIHVRNLANANSERLSVSEAINGCFKAKQAELKGDGKAGRWMSPLEVHVIPKIGSKAIEDIDQHELKKLLEPIWHEKPEAARKSLNRMNLTLQHAAALGLDVDMQATLKAKALLGKQRHTVTHIPSLPYSDTPKFYQWLRTKETVSALALRLLILTAARTSEIRFAEFGEFNDGIWTLGPERTKTGRAHRIWLLHNKEPDIAKNSAATTEAGTMSSCFHAKMRRRSKKNSSCIGQHANSCLANSGFNFARLANN